MFVLSVSSDPAVNLLATIVLVVVVAISPVLTYLVSSYLLELPGKIAVARYQRRADRQVLAARGVPLEFEMSAYVPAARELSRTR